MLETDWLLAKKKPKENLSQGQLRWACRRGMLELDILLGDFFEVHYVQLSESDKQAFEQLLSLSDQDLYGFFLSDNQPVDGNIIRIVQIILSAAVD